MAAAIRTFERIGAFEFAPPYFIERQRAWRVVYRLVGGTLEMDAEHATPDGAFLAALHQAAALAKEHQIK